MRSLARGAGRGGEISVFGASPFFLKDALVRTTLGVNWGLEGVAADDDDDANSFQGCFYSVANEATLHWSPLLSINRERLPLTLLFET